MAGLIIRRFNGLTSDSSGFNGGLQTAAVGVGLVGLRTFAIMTDRIRPAGSLADDAVHCASLDVEDRGAVLACARNDGMPSLLFAA